MGNHPSALHAVRKLKHQRDLRSINSVTKQPSSTHHRTLICSWLPSCPLSHATNCQLPQLRRIPKQCAGYNRIRPRAGGSATASSQQRFRHRPDHRSTTLASKLNQCTRRPSDNRQRTFADRTRNGPAAHNHDSPPQATMPHKGPADAGVRGPRKAMSRYKPRSSNHNPHSRSLSSIAERCRSRSTPHQSVVTPVRVEIEQCNNGGPDTGASPVICNTTYFGCNEWQTTPHRVRRRNGRAGRKTQPNAIQPAAMPFGRQHE